MRLNFIRRDLFVSTLLLLGLLVWQGPAAAQQGVVADGQAGLTPPQVLIDASLFPSVDGDAAKRAGLTWAAVLEATEPAPWPSANEANAAGVLPHDAEALIKQSAAASKNGQAFRAVQLLREAEERAPGHPAVLRALGLAHAESGNLTRAANDLSKIIANQRDDIDALIVLARHAAQSRSLEQALTYCSALEEAGAAIVGDYVRAMVLSDLGYTAAASERLAIVLDAIKGLDLDQLNEQSDASTLYARELRVLKAISPQLRIQQGDLLMQSGDDKQAAKVYASIELEDATARHALVARRVYLALRAGDEAKAIDQAIALLSEPNATQQDAQLVVYLLAQGVSAQALTQRTEAMLQAKGATLPRLIALSAVADRARLLKPINDWLSDGPVSPDRLAQAVALIRFDDREPDDALALASILELVAKRMQQSPSEAFAYAQSAIDKLDTPVTLLRAIRSEAFAADQNAYKQLLSAVAYEQVGRLQEALQAYQPLLESDEAFAPQVLLPVVRLQLVLGQGDQAHALMDEPAIDAAWDEFELAMRAMAAAGKARQAVAIVDQRIKARGKQIDLDVLRIKLIAQMGQPQEACNLLLRLISTQPSDESLYRLGIDLAYIHRANFNRIADADRMRRAFLTRLISNLPDAPLSRMSMAQNIKSNPARIDEAEQLLLDVLQDNPKDAGVLSLLVELYDEKGDEASAQAIFERYVDAVSPGVSRALLIAERAVTLQQGEQATRVIDEVFNLDKEGVLPGQAVTGDDASSLLHYLEAADAGRDTEALYLSMVRRFPDHAGLNNALGYRWAVQDKNLKQAEAMIKRALKSNATNHSILDSLAWVQYKLGDLDSAQATQSRALMTLEAMLARMRGPGFGLPDDAVAEFGATTAILNDHMGDILYKQGETRKALDHWRVAAKQPYTEEEMRFDPELRTLEARLKAKIDAMADGQPAPVPPIPGPESHGPDGHPADIEPGLEAPEDE